MPTFSIWLTDEEKKTIDVMAEAEQRSFSNMAVVLMRLELARRQQLTLPTPAPAGDGAAVSAQEGK